MAKKKDKKIPTAKEIKKKAVELINILDMACLDGDIPETDDEFKELFTTVRGVAGKKLLANLYGDNMTGILALKDVAREAHKLLALLNDSNSGRTGREIKISWDD